MFNFLAPLPNFYFCKGDWTLKHVWTCEELPHSVCSDNDLVLFHLKWKETRLTDKKVSKYFVSGYSSSEVGSVKSYLESDYELGFYLNQFWDLPKLLCFHKTLESISVCKSWNYCSNHDLPLNHQLQKCYSISNHCEWNFIRLGKWSVVL